MAIRRKTPKPHVVFVDTNVLWHEDKSHVVAPEFDQAWDANAKLVTLELVVPDVVRSELIFQQVTSCWKKLEQITKLFGEVSGIAAVSHKTRLTREKLRSQVEAKIDRWLKARRARIPEVPHSSIDWSRLIADAVWRRPPFTFDAKQPDVEKGFRDALIVETIVSEASADARDVNLAFITSDKLLQGTVSSRLKSDGRFAAHENMPTFSSHVKLVREALDNAFIREIVTRASEKFYAQDDDQSLFQREGILKKLMDEGSLYFANPEQANSPMSIVTPALNLGTAWQPVSLALPWIMGHEFVAIEPERTFHWRTKVWLTVAYRGKNAFAFNYAIANQLGHPEECALFLVFDVYWAALVKTDARFSHLKLERIELVEHSFRAPSAQERKPLGFLSGDQPG